MAGELTRGERRAFGEPGSSEPCLRQGCSHPVETHMHYTGARDCAVRGCECPAYAGRPGRVAAFLRRILGR